MPTKTKKELHPEIVMVEPKLSENFMEPSECGAQSAYQKDAIDRWNKLTDCEKQEMFEHLKYLCQRLWLKNGTCDENACRFADWLPLVKDPDNSPYSMS